MKKTLFLAIMAGAALAGCVKNEEVAKSSGGSPERITFDAPVVSIPTRATEIADNFPTGRDFGVYALYHIGNYPGTESTTYMNNVQCTYTTTGKTEEPNEYWAPVGAYYWPKTENSKLTFGAYSPSSMSTDWPAGAQVVWDNEGFTISDFKVNNTPTNQIDLLYSDRVFNKTKADNDATNVPNSTNGATPYDGIQIPFKHALSSIVFTARAQTEKTIILTGITVNNIYSKGTFDQGLSYVSGTQDTETPGWSGYSEPVNYTIYTNSVVTPTDNDALGTDKMYFNAETAVTNGMRKSDLLVLPQNLNSDGRKTGYGVPADQTPTNAIVTISYKIKNGTGWKDQVTEYKLATNTKDSPIYNWAINTRYTYDIAIGVDKIYFSAMVTDFKTGTTVLVNMQ